ncbi:MAG: HNH endonuclease [Treponema sp.]|jgi:hypothetical protein|nr:HNH endonuclease [Treponema sp.]
MKKIFYIIFFFSLVVYIFADEVEATNNGIANALPGDYIIRENGDKVILNQTDIDYAKNQLKLNVTPVNQYTARIPNERNFYFGYYFIIIFIIGIGVFILFKNLYKTNNYNNNKGKTYIDENGYRRFSDSNKLVHRYVAEKKIGRKLRQEEIVHHINRNKLDNSPENLEVFANQAEHEKHHKETDWLFKLNRRISRRFRFKLW